MSRRLFHARKNLGEEEKIVFYQLGFSKDFPHPIPTEFFQNINCEQYLDAFSYLYRRLCLSIRRSVRRSVRPSVAQSSISEKWAELEQSSTMNMKLWYLKEDSKKSTRAAGRSPEGI